MARLNDEDIETLRTVASYGEPLTYAELGAMLTEGAGMRSERRRGIGMRRCRSLFEGGAVMLNGQQKVCMTEKGRLALALDMGKRAMREARALANTEART